MYATALREQLAKKELLPAEFFHANEIGINGPGRTPVIRIVGGKTWTGILGTGEESKDLINAAVMPALDILSTHYHKPVQIELETISVSMNDRDAYKLYWVREMAVKRGTLGQSGEALNAVLASKIKRSIERQAMDAGMEGMLPADIDVRVVAIERQLGMRLQTSTGWTNQYVGLFNLTIAMPIDLKGMWFAGNLTSRGYGRIIPVNNYGV